MTIKNTFLKIQAAANTTEKSIPDKSGGPALRAAALITAYSDSTIIKKSEKNIKTSFTKILDVYRRLLSYVKVLKHRLLAQLVEHRSPKPGVGGSSPSWPASLSFSNTPSQAAYQYTSSFPSRHLFRSL